MLFDATSKQKEKTAVAVELSLVPGGSITLFTLPLKRKESDTPLATTVANSATSRTDLSPTIHPRHSRRPPPIIVVTPPSSKIEEDITSTRPSTGFSSSHSKVSSNSARTSPPSSQTDDLAAKEFSHATRSQQHRTSYYGHALVMSSTTKSTTHLPLLNPVRMHDIPLTPRAPTPALRQPATGSTARWSSYFAPVSLPRPLSVIGEHVVEHLHPHPLHTNPTHPPPRRVLGPRQVGWRSGDRVIELQNERLNDLLEATVSTTKRKRTCWEGARECIGRKVEVWKSKFWSGMRGTYS